MELFILLAIAFSGVGVATVVSEENAKDITYGQKQTRIIKETRQTVYDRKLVQDWE